MNISPFCCRACGSTITQSFADLGMTPLANDYLSQQQIAQPQTYYPLHAGVCSHCRLVQIDAFETPDRIFSDYAYFSSCSSSWVEHAKKFAHNAIENMALNKNSLVIEIASNDGYLLQHFKHQSIPVLGIEPAKNIAQQAIANGITTEVRFFGKQTAKDLAQKSIQADLIVANNVLAHVPNLNDFVSGMPILLKQNGRISIEFPHLVSLIQDNQFDTIYHEHFSYFSLHSLEMLLQKHKLVVVDIEQLTTHGGSLRVTIAHEQIEPEKEAQNRINHIRKLEQENQLDQLIGYQNYQKKIEQTKTNLLAFLIEAKKQGKIVVGYGAPAKGNTMLNFCGIRPDLISYTVDISPHKQSLFLPGSLIPIFHPNKIFETKPDYVLILPWNLKDEIINNMKDVKSWGGQFVVAVPELAFY